MSKRKFHSDDGETFEVIDDPQKPKGKPKPRRAPRRYLIAGLLAALLIMLGLTTLLLTRTRIKNTLPATEVSPAATGTPAAPLPSPTTVISVPSETPDPCSEIMNDETSRIALAAELRGNDQAGLYLMDTGGRHLCPLDVLVGGQPRWSHDGERLLYEVAVADQGISPSPHSEIVTLSVRSGELTYITYVGTGLQSEPFWSPDDSQIVFRQQDDLYLINDDSSNLRQITGKAGHNERPAWSPDGRWIAFASTRDQAESQRERDSFEIYVMAADGSSVRRLTHNALYDHMPAWSPDSSQIAYIAKIDPDSDAHTDLFVIDANCDQHPEGCEANRRNLTHSGDDIHAPVWLSDGQHIAYTASERDGDVAIYALDLASGETRRITRPPVHVLAFDWWGN